MYYIVTIVITAFVWAAGQMLMLNNSAVWGGIMILGAIGGGLFFLTKKREKTAAMIGRINAPSALAFFSLIIAVLAAVIVRSSPVYGLVFFIISGILLLLAKPVGEKFFDFFEIPEKTQPMQRWEPWFFIIFMAVSAFVRFYQLGDFPKVAFGNEGTILGNCFVLASKGVAYKPHVGGGTSWPTLTYYMGIFFTKIFGWDIVTFRASNVVLSLISLAAYYFLARRITSPFTAAVTSVMYSVFIMHLTASRLFVSPFTILFIPHVICLGILLFSAKNPKWYLYLAAGLACGYSLQGYFPGRGVILLFAGWFILMLITRKKLFHNPVNFLLFIAGFLIVSAPVVHYAVTNPEGYWSYVNSVSASKTGGIKGYINTIISQVPSFAGIFHYRSAWETNYHYPYTPIVDFAAGALFAPAFFMCLFVFWKPIPAILLIIFCGGMIPGLLGAGSSVNPNAPRVELVFPVIFLLAGLMFERVKRVFWIAGKRAVKIAVIAAGVVIALWSFQSGIREFVKVFSSPVLLLNQHHFLYLMHKEMKEHPDSAVYSTPFYTLSDAAIIYTPKPDRDYRVKKYIEDMLVMNRGKDYLLLLDPFYYDLAGLFRENFPNARVKVYGEDEKGMKNEYYDETRFKKHVSAFKHTNKHVPYVFTISVNIPKEDITDFQSMLLIKKGPGKWERKTVFASGDFAGKYAGRKVTLKGAVIIEEADKTRNREKPVKFTMGWEGFTLFFDGKKAGFNREIKTDSGVHFFKLSGVVPAGAAGSLPLKIFQDNRDLGAEGRVVALSGPFGARIFSSPGPGSWDKPYVYSHRMITPNINMYDGRTMHLPYSLRLVTMMRPPEDGEYLIEGNLDNKSIIKVNGKEVFNNIEIASHAESKPITLSKGKPVKIEFIQLVDGVPVIHRALTIKVKLPGSEEKILAPYEWFYPAQ